MRGAWLRWARLRTSSAGLVSASSSSLSSACGSASAALPIAPAVPVERCPWRSFSPVAACVRPAAPASSRRWASASESRISPASHRRACSSSRAASATRAPSNDTAASTWRAIRASTRTAAWASATATTSTSRSPTNRSRSASAAVEEGQVEHAYETTRAPRQPQGMARYDHPWWPRARRGRVSARRRARRAVLLEPGPHGDAGGHPGVDRPGRAELGDGHHLSTGVEGLGRQPGALLTEEQHAALGQRRGLRGSAPSTTSTPTSGRPALSAHAIRPATSAWLADVLVAVGDHGAPAVPAASADDVDLGGRKALALRTHGPDVPVVLPVLDGHVEGVAALVEVGHHGLAPPVAVAVDDVAPVAPGQQLGIQPGIVGPGPGWGPTPTPASSSSGGRGTSGGSAGAMAAVLAEGLRPGVPCGRAACEDGGDDRRLARRAHRRPPRRGGPRALRPHHPHVRPDEGLRDGRGGSPPCAASAGSRPGTRSATRSARSARPPSTPSPGPPAAATAADGGGTVAATAADGRGTAAATRR